MTTARPRFELALERLAPSQWEEFERLASAFLASEYPTLRTMASTSGDRGRDSELYHENSTPRVVFQYSVASDWEAKIRATANRLGKTFPEISVLRFVTNQEIGARADKLKRELLSLNITLDVLDRSWFLERYNLDSNRASAAAHLSELVVDPLLRGRGLTSRESMQLSDDEFSVALFFLDMQRADDAAEKNLTRSCFEALVKASLAGSSIEEPVPRAEVYRRVMKFLPRYELSQIQRFIDSALGRLKKRVVNEWKESDSFNLNFEESSRIADEAAKSVIRQGQLRKEIEEIVQESPDVKVEDISRLSKIVISSIQDYFLKKGEAFASALTHENDPPLDHIDIRDIVSSHDISCGISGRDPLEYLVLVTTSVLSAPSPSARDYLRSLSDAYTLMAFLSETPDVQTATNKLFSQGTIWLDTSVLLPLFPEARVEEGSRPFSTTFKQAMKSGATLRITPGVIEEVERHLNKCRAYANSDHWQGGTPYVYQQYVIQGGTRDRFSSWLEHFIGDFRPEEDIADFLKQFGISVEEPVSPVNLSSELVDAVKEYWRQAQDRRRGAEEFNIRVEALARHDFENSLTVLNARESEVGRGGIGYRSWWLTLDKFAYYMKDDPEILRTVKSFHSPVLSLDFLLKFLTFGPARDRVFHDEHSSMRVFAPEIFDHIPADLMSVAERVRKENANLPQHIVRRRIRDALDRAKANLGKIHKGGLDGVSTAIEDML